MSQKIGKLPAGLEKTVVAHILRYDLHFHQSLVAPIKDAIQKNSPNGSNIHISRTTWRVINFLCHAYLSGESVSLSDVYLSIGVSKGTAISCLNSLESWGAIIKTSAPGDKRRLNIQFSKAYELLIEDFVHYWAERFSKEVAPYEFQEEAPAPASSESLPIHTLQKLHKILNSADMIRTQALGVIQPAGYVRYAADIRELTKQMLGDEADAKETTPIKKRL